MKMSVRWNTFCQILPFPFFSLVRNSNLFFVVCTWGYLDDRTDEKAAIIIVNLVVTGEEVPYKKKK